MVGFPTADVLSHRAGVVAGTSSNAAAGGKRSRELAIPRLPAAIYCCHHHSQRGSYERERIGALKTYPVV